MGLLVIMGAMLECNFGSMVVEYNVPPENQTMAGNKPAANVMDNKPMFNVSSFGPCKCPSNPAVQAATAAACGVFTPAPCMPNIVGPWDPGSSDTMIGEKPALNDSSKLNCTYGGVISITNPGQEPGPGAVMVS